MIKYTDYEFSLIFDEENIEGIEKIIVSLKQGNIQINKEIQPEEIDTENHLINLSFTQEETATLKENSVASIQANVWYSNGRKASNEVNITISRNLLAEVIK